MVSGWLVIIMSTSANKIQLNQAVSRILVRWVNAPLPPEAKKILKI